MQDYPARSDRINELCQILKISRRSLRLELEATGLDQEGWSLLYGLANRLAINSWFEHLSSKEIRNQLQRSILLYRRSKPRPQLRKFAGEVLDEIAKKPMVRTLYLGIENIVLPNFWAS